MCRRITTIYHADLDVIMNHKGIISFILVQLESTFAILSNTTVAYTNAYSKTTLWNSECAIIAIITHQLASHFKSQLAVSHRMVIL